MRIAIAVAIGIVLGLTLLPLVEAILRSIP
jgi:hypothetical protein